MYVNKHYFKHNFVIMDFFSKNDISRRFVARVKKIFRFFGCYFLLFGVAFFWQVML